MTRHLMRLAHSRIGVIAGLADSSIVRDRLAGFQSVLQVSELEFDEGLVVYTDMNMLDGELGASTLLSNEYPPTTLFCMNDELATGAIHGAKKLGLRVPEDVSVVGFDNIDFAAFTDPPLTTVNHRAEDLGCQAMKMFHERFENNELPANRLMLSFEIVERQSTGPCPKP
jgi:LacI family repressor for deo operon, udp, cdd, tsx, nupC, and nupG